MYGQFFHRFVGRVGKRNAVALEHALRIGDFAAAGVDFGISRVRAAFLTDGLEAFGLDGEAEQLVFVGFDHARQVGRLQIVGNQRGVGGADAILQRKVEAGRRSLSGFCR